MVKSMNQPERQRRVVLFDGHVQGVGFRYTTRQIAADFQVAGFVENLPDGRVRLVCEGPSGEVDRFVTAINGQMGGFIRSVQSSREAASGEFNSFFIRR